MSSEVLLSKLDKVRRTGPGTWLASCPTSNHANGDKHPSLSIRENDDGTVLVRCHSQQCSAYEIVSAVGLEMSDLFPPRTDQHFVKGSRRPFPAADILRAIAGEVQLVYLSAQAVHKGEVLTDADLSRLLMACSRIQAAMTAGGIQ